MAKCSFHCPKELCCQILRFFFFKKTCYVQARVPPLCTCPSDFFVPIWSGQLEPFISTGHLVRDAADRERCVWWILKALLTSSHTPGQGKGLNHPPPAFLQGKCLPFIAPHQNLYIFTEESLHIDTLGLHPIPSCPCPGVSVTHFTGLDPEGILVDWPTASRLLKQAAWLHHQLIL